MRFFNRLSAAAQIRQLQCHWDQDRRLRRRVPLRDSWRGCLGLALLLDQPDDTYCHGDLALVRNDQLTWLALRDVPTDLSRGRRRTGPSYATSTMATLRYGMPALDFTREVRDTIDLQKMPFNKRLFVAGPPWELRFKKPVGDTLDAGDIRRFAALTRLSTAMTTFAFFATDISGRPWRPTWARHRPDGDCFVHPKPAAGMPIPYLAFDLQDAGRLQAALFDSDQIPTPAVYEEFCKSLAEGLVLRSVGPEVYEGKVGEGPGARLHQLRSMIDNSSRFVRVPAGTRTLVRRGHALQPAQPWARVLSHPLHYCRLEYTADLPWRWSWLRKACGGTASRDQLLRLWFDHQLIRLESAPEQFLVPANLVSRAAIAVRPSQLWWDTAPMLPYYDWEIQAAILPPVPLQSWDRLQMPLGEVVVNAATVLMGLQGLTLSAISVPVSKPCVTRTANLRDASTQAGLLRLDQRNRREPDLAIAG